MKLPHQVWSSFTSSGLNTNTVRRRFLEYFIDENHYERAKSIPVAAHFDHFTSDFVIHSGACQFARVFTGEEAFNLEKSSGIQKCVTLSTDNNCLEPFNHDLHKLSFFEMPSFWSRRADLRKESCRLSWNFLTTVLELDPETLSVSYFRGDDKLGLPSDEEIRETWLELGVSASRILSRDSTSNFWKLSTAGPCGPCTKIYVTLPGSINMLELWNIRFLKYNLVDGILRVLPMEYISAGSGLERLTSVSQRTYSCYHIDSFMPLFVTIQKISGAPEYDGKFDRFDLNVRYRQLADFIRTVTVAVTDDLYPDTNTKLKRLLHKALYIARTDFKQDNPHHMLTELSTRVAETLQETYPEIGENVNKVHLVIENEENVLQEVVANRQKWWAAVQERYSYSQSLSSVRTPESIEFFRHVGDVINSSPSDKLLSNEISKLGQKFGIPHSALDKILAHFGPIVDRQGTETGERDRTERSAATKGLAYLAKYLRSIGIVSDDTLKHSYFRNGDGYTFPNVRARLLAIVDGEASILSVDVERHCLRESLKESSRAEVCLRDREFGFVCDRTNFTADGDQCHDVGYIVFDEKYKFEVNRVKKIGNLMIHYATPHFSDKNMELKTGTGVEVTLSIDAEHRLKLMRNHTLSHLLVIALKEIFSVIHFKRAKISHEYCRHNITVLGKEVDVDDFGELLEQKVGDYIRRKLPICAKHYDTSFQILCEPNMFYFSNIIYPYQNIRAVGILDENRNVITQELCDEVHVFNTGDIGLNITIPRVRCAQRKCFNVTAIVEPVTTKALELQSSVRSETTLLQDEVNKMLKSAVCTDQLVRMSEKVYSSWFKMARDFLFTPYLVTRSAYADVGKIKDMMSELTSKLSATPSEILVRALRSRIEEFAAVDKFAVYFCPFPIPFFKQLSFIVDILYRNNFPTLFLCYHCRKVAGVCYVPEHYVTDDFNAEIWVNLTIQGFANKLEIREEVDNKVFCYLKGERVKYSSVTDYIESLTTASRMVAEKYFVRRHR